ncbi:MAG TPA: preprotein translocase subunit SecG [Phycisphaerae bacterium]|nr:preprotein translocase subunit SecG [Phycisphaerae bacterium]HRW53203.1 preprotein translocase subunit SecG [Phycisphaerae bacterium]
MLAIGYGAALIGILIILISVLLIGLVLLQKNRGSGLSGAFGGVGGHSAFGTKTGDFLTWFTVSLAFLFLVLCVVGNFVFEPSRPLARTPAAVTPVATEGEGDVTGSTDSSGSSDSTPADDAETTDAGATDTGATDAPSTAE